MTIKIGVFNYDIFIIIYFSVFNYVIRLMAKISKDRLEYDERKKQENK